MEYRVKINNTNTIFNNRHEALVFARTEIKARGPMTHVSGVYRRPVCHKQDITIDHFWFTDDGAQKVLRMEDSNVLLP